MNRGASTNGQFFAKPFAWRAAFAAAFFATVIAAWLWFNANSQSPDSAKNQIRPSLQVDQQPSNSRPATIPDTEKTENRNQILLNGVHASSDRWPTEAFSEKATKWLKELAKLAPFTADQVKTITSSAVAIGPLRPKQIKQTSISETVNVGRSTAGTSPQTTEIALDEALRDLFQPMTQGARCDLKIVRVQQTDDGFDTVVHAEGGGANTEGVTQWTANWICAWTEKGELTKVAATDYEEVRSTGETNPWFVDATAQAIGQTTAYREQLLYGMDYWVDRLEHRLYVNRLGHHGLAIADFDGDSLEDVFVCQPGGLPNLLFLHQLDGTATEAAEPLGLNILDDTTAALAVDLDNDGDQDLVMLTVSGAYIFANDGAGHFTIEQTLPDCRNTFSITAADFDNDGLLDLYVGRYWPEESGRGAIPLPVPYYDATNGGANMLFRNTSGWNFQDVTDQVGLNQNNTRYTMAAAWEDFDNDGDQDLYVANDFGRNCLYQNTNGRFKNVAATTGVEDTAAGMSVSWSDYNHDGLTDLYVGNMFSSAGGRIAYQRQYAERFDKVAQKKLQRLARGNSLFQNQDGERFLDKSIASATTMGRWAWGSLFADINNDSWDDLVVANGHVTTEDNGDL